MIKNGVTYTAANLHPGVVSDFPLKANSKSAGRSRCALANDAAVQGYGAIKGDGVELVLTLGTGLGSSLFTDGHLCPGLELGHHPWKRDREYEDYLGRRGLDKYGKKRWNKLLQEAIEQTASSSTGTTSTWAAATPRKSTSSPARTLRSSPTKPALLGGVALWREWN